MILGLIVILMLKGREITHTERDRRVQRRSEDREH
jgi:hypothetical protein